MCNIPRQRRGIFVVIRRKECQGDATIVAVGGDKDKWESGDVWRQRCSGAGADDLGYGRDACYVVSQAIMIHALRDDAPVGGDRGRAVV